MTRDLDTRDFTRNRATPQRATELQTLATMISDRLPGGHRIAIERLDPATGNAAHIVSRASPPSTDRNFVQRALRHVRAIAPAIGLTNQAIDFVAGAALERTASGAHAVHLQQRYKAVPVFQATITVRFAPDGRLQDTSGQTINVARDASAVPRRSVEDAVRAAAIYAGGPADGELDAGASPALDLAGFEPRIRTAAANVPERACVLEPGPFGAEIKANLVWFARGDQLVLGWRVVLAIVAGGPYDQVIVDAGTALPLYCRRISPLPTGTGHRADRDALAISSPAHAGGDQQGRAGAADRSSTG